MSEALTVTELTQNIKSLLEQNFGRMYLQGEISNLARPSSGHMYFNVKDDRSQIAGVMFRSSVQRIRFDLENGLEVLLHGRVTVYEPRGVYQIIVDRIEPLGSGALQLAFEQLKNRLMEEGLFDPEIKKEIPFIPRGIGIVTSPTGAAIQDILNILERRFPSIPVLINPVAVQGDSAAGEIAVAINQFQEIEEIDVIITGRGGGSIEDLWAFNEEIVARAIHASKIPVISAVGHETDFTISDFVADLRAPTPSAAAELVVPLKEDLLNRITDNRQRLDMKMFQRIELLADRLKNIQKRLRSPVWIIQGHMMKVDELNGKLRQLTQQRFERDKSSWKIINQRLLFHSPLNRLEVERYRLNDLSQQLIKGMKTVLDANKNKLVELTHVLNSVSPLSVLNRGYAAATDPDGQVISSINQVKEKSNIKVHVSDGTIEGVVEKITKDKIIN